MLVKIRLEFGPCIEKKKWYVIFNVGISLGLIRDSHRSYFLQAEVKTMIRAKEETATIRLSEICSGSSFFFHVVGNEAAKVIDESMKIFTRENGTSGAPCDLKAGKNVAALFDDGTGKSWYRARVIEKRPGKAKVLFVDHGNVATLAIATHLRPLDITLGTNRIPAVAKEAVLAAVKTRGLDDDDGIEAARLLQSAAWGKDVSARIFCENEGKLVVALYEPGNSCSINEELVTNGLARVSKPFEIEKLCTRMINSENLSALAADLRISENSARKNHTGIWRYGDVGDDDEEEY
jgi:staphylococcal nuclease domain-containing protein 1